MDEVLKALNEKEAKLHDDSTPTEEDRSRSMTPPSMKGGKLSTPPPPLPTQPPRLVCTVWLSLSYRGLTA